MATPYRSGPPPKPLQCPRCTKELPPMDVARCTNGCGTWVTQFASTEVLTEVDLKPDPVTRWWRMRAPCPVCAEKMLLYGDEPGLFQGCDLHGYFIDADMVQHTGLAREIDPAILERKRDDTSRVDAEREAINRAEEQRAREQMQLARREVEVGARVDQMVREQEIARSDRPVHYLRLIATGASASVANYILDLEERIEKLEARLAQLERKT